MVVVQGGAEPKIGKSLKAKIWRSLRGVIGPIYTQKIVVIAVTALKGLGNLGVDTKGVRGYKRDTSTKTIRCLEPGRAELQEVRVFEGKRGGRVVSQDQALPKLDKQVATQGGIRHRV
jgi:hypothetical protein